jgi:LmbE family N-acetylglucosaminyl deacetylase
MVTAVGEARFQRLLARSRPFDEADLRRLSPLLIVSPHQDDETLGAGGLIATASALGLRPRVAYLTDGGASHRGSSYWTRERLARLRAEEAIAALGDLGVPPDDILFLGWRDAQPHPLGSIERDNTVTALKRWTADRAPASVWSTWAGEAHCDHLATAQVAEAFRASSDPRPAGFAYVVWGWNEEGLENAGDPRSLACPATVELRVRALARHASQTTDLIADAPQAFRLPADVAAVTSRTSEVFFGLP